MLRGGEAQASLCRLGGDEGRQEVLGFKEDNVIRVKMSAKVVVQWQVVHNALHIALLRKCSEAH